MPLRKSFYVNDDQAQALMSMPRDPQQGGADGGPIGAPSATPARMLMPGAQQTPGPIPGQSMFQYTLNRDRALNAAGAAAFADNAPTTNLTPAQLAERKAYIARKQAEAELAASTAGAGQNYFQGRQLAADANIRANDMNKAQVGQVNAITGQIIPAQAGEINSKAAVNNANANRVNTLVPVEVQMGQADVRHRDAQTGLVNQQTEEGRQLLAPRVTNLNLQNERQQIENTDLPYEMQDRRNNRSFTTELRRNYEPRMREAQVQGQEAQNKLINKQIDTMSMPAQPEPINRDDMTKLATDLANARARSRGAAFRYSPFSDDTKDILHHTQREMGLVPGGVEKKIENGKTLYRRWSDDKHLHWTEATPLDSETAAQFLQYAGGNKERARQLAVSAGFTL